MSEPGIRAPTLRHVFDAWIDVGTPWEVGETAGTQRRLIPILGGRLEGPGLVATVLPGGADDQTIAPDGLTRLHARYAVETDAGERILVENVGVRSGPPEALDRIRRGLPVDPDLIYFRTTPRFETSSPRLAWMTATVFVASGRRTPDQVLISVFAV